MASIEHVQSKIRFNLEGMIARGRSPSAFLNRNFFAMFKNAQKERFQTENASQQGKWAPLDPLYVRRRRKAFPGSGSAILVRTSRMARGAQALDSGYYYKTVSDDRFVLGINLGELPYAKYPGRKRPFMSFTEETLQKWHRAIGDYIFKGKTA